MISRKFAIFLGVLTAFTIAVALFGAANMPNGAWSYSLAHKPGVIVWLAVIWILVPGALGLLLLVNSKFAFFNRIFNGGRPMAPDRQRWSERVTLVLGLFMAADQLFQTSGLVLYWHRHEIPAVARAVQGPHFLGFPDPYHISFRLLLLSGGVLFAWFGNGLPKLLNPFRGGRPETYDWTRMIRSLGRIFVFFSLASIACAFVPDVRSAALAAGATYMLMCVALTLSWASYRFAGPPSLPTEG